MIAGLPFQEARFRDYTAKRRIVSYEAPPEFLRPLQARVAAWLDIAAADLRQFLVTEYRAGTALGWHRDSPEYGLVCGVSLAAPCRMTFRPMSFKPSAPRKGRKEVLSLELAPRSAYRLSEDARWRWQHGIPATKALRYSITFRTLA